MGNTQMFSKNVDLATTLARCFALRQLANFDDSILAIIKREEERLHQTVLPKIQCDYTTAQDSIDNVLVCMYMVYCAENKICNDFSIQFQRILEDISNIEFEKYRLLNNELFSRKIHGSYHFSNPLVLLYWAVRYLSVTGIQNREIISITTRYISQCKQNSNMLSIHKLVWLCLIVPSDDVLYHMLVSRINEIEFRPERTSGFYFVNIGIGETSWFGYTDDYRVLAAIVIRIMVLRITKHSCIFESYSVPKHNTEIDRFDAVFLQYKIICKNKAGARITMRNNCMSPVIKDGDIMTVISYSEYCVGDIIVFRYYRKKILAHRIMEIVHSDNQQSVYITTTESGQMWGYPVFGDEIIGKVILVNNELINLTN